MQARDPKYYKPLKDLAKARDGACFQRYRAIFRDLPEEEQWKILPPDVEAPCDVELHHVDHRSGCASADVEENVIAVNGWLHRIYIHGPGEPAVRKAIREYLHSKEVEAWRKEHAAEIAAVEALKEECRIRTLRKHCTVKRCR